MRALGAGRSTVMTIVLLESIFIALAGGLIGWAVAHFGAWGASGLIEEWTGVRVGLLDFVTAEVILIPALLLLAVIVGFLPALTAYRTDVAKSLQ
jgi:putative ABC transport system permease protein